MAIHQTYSALNNGQHRPERDLDHLHTNFSRASIDNFTPELAGFQTETAFSTAGGHIPKSKLPKPKPDTKEDRYDWNGSWTWEIAAATLSVMGFALLIGFLVKVHGTPYVSWQYTVSPNTVVSIIVTITKAALLVPVSACLSQLKWNQYCSSAPLYHMQAIDQASRGPWGSLQVLWRGIPGARIDSLTLVGSFITVIALAIDPFSQQILSFPSRSVHTLNETASIQTVHRYSSPGFNSNPNNQHIQLPPSIISAIMSGIAQTNRPLEPQCSSGNCTYPSFVTLGVCSHCEDVTTRTNQSCQPQENSVLWNRDEVRTFKEIPVNCTYTLPGAIEVNLPFEDIFLDLQVGDVVPLTLDFWISHASSVGVFDIQKPIISFIVTNQSVTLYYSLKNVTVPLPKPSLTACAVYYCERKYSPSSFFAISKDSYSINVSSTQQLVFKDPPPGQIAGTVPLLPPGGRDTLSNDSSYTVDGEYTFLPLYDVLYGIFNTSANSYDAIGSGTLSLTQILRNGNLSQLLDSMSTSISDAFRASTSSDKVPGKAYRVETFIDVRWPWIILPGTAILGSLALLLGTAMASQKQHAVLWKDSVLPLLMSHLETTPEHEIASLRNVDQVHRMSEKIDVMIDQSRGPLVFIES